MSGFLLFAAVAFLFIGGIMLLIEAFGEGILWGLGCLLVPPVSLIFVATHWHQAKKAFFFQLAGWILLMFALHTGAQPQ
jgi:hypothetical protein